MTVTLKAAPADATAEWLALARTNARAVTVEARLTRSNAAAPSNAGPATLGNATAPAAPPANRDAQGLVAPLKRKMPAAE